MKLSQRVPLYDRGIDTRFNFPVINGTSLDANDFSIRSILERNMARNITTFLAPVIQVWTPAPAGSSANFEFDFTINFPEDTIVYYSGFWELIKWAWVQYFSVLVIFIYIIRRIREFVFGNRIVNVVPERQYG
uniref:Transmembrane protein 231 n=1 Tax=Plectus sambesii TaxID=2011161 RepID=A0A914WRD5_9BILA